MADVAEFINKKSSISVIDKTYEDNFKQRRRLGLSQVGHSCPRFLWYKHHGFDEPVPDGRVLRLFELGNVIETQMDCDLTQAGFNITDTQKHVEFTMDDITLTGSIDGIITGLVESNKPHLWECKSMGSKGWKNLLKNGYENYSDVYKGQVHAYMLGLGLKKAFVTVYNKDTSELYQEMIDLKEDWIIGRLQDVFKAISQDHPPLRACPDADYFEAKFCNFYGECWKV